MWKAIHISNPRERILRARGAEQNWQIFKAIVVTVQKFSIPVRKKPGKEGKIPAWSKSPAGQNKEQEGAAQAVEAGTGNLGGI